MNSVIPPRGDRQNQAARLALKAWTPSACSSATNVDVGLAKMCAARDMVPAAS